MTYKVGNIIATKTYNGTYHLSIISDIKSVASGECILECQIIYEDFKDCSKFLNRDFSVVLPQQENSIVPKEEYFKAMQNKINEQQEKLNAIKEIYKEVQYE